MNEKSAKLYRKVLHLHKLAIGDNFEADHPIFKMVVKTRYEMLTHGSHKDKAAGKRQIKREIRMLKTRLNNQPTTG